ncbi:hypothetical protein BGZ73_006740 [Actinomortierella ambigua]|nr:hypothetical protein BGZ73_006740 [Actinomortierella ambigua]
MKFSLAAVTLVLAVASSTCDAAYNVKAVLAAGRSQIGVKYVWGGGHGPRPGRTKGGFDCSGLVRYAIYKGSGIDLGKGGNTDNQLRDRHTKQIACSKLQAGDLIFWGTQRSTYHVALFSGAGKMIEAPRTGIPVRETKYRKGNICARVR